MSAKFDATISVLNRICGGHRQYYVGRQREQQVADPCLELRKMTALRVHNVSPKSVVTKYAYAGNTLQKFVRVQTVNRRLHR